MKFAVLLLVSICDIAFIPRALAFRYDSSDRQSSHVEDRRANASGFGATAPAVLDDRSSEPCLESDTWTIKPGIKFGVARSSFGAVYMDQDRRAFVPPPSDPGYLKPDRVVYETVRNSSRELMVKFQDGYYAKAVGKPWNTVFYMEFPGQRNLTKFDTCTVMNPSSPWANSPLKMPGGNR